MSIELLFGDASGNALPWTNLIVNSIQANNIIDLSGNVTLNDISCNNINANTGHIENLYTGIPPNEIYIEAIGTQRSMILTDPGSTPSNFMVVDNSNTIYPNITYSGLEANNLIADVNLTAKQYLNMVDLNNSSSSAIIRANSSIPMTGNRLVTLDIQNKDVSLLVSDSSGNVNNNNLTITDLSSTNISVASIICDSVEAFVGIEGFMTTPVRFLAYFGNTSAASPFTYSNVILNIGVNTTTNAAWTVPQTGYYLINVNSQSQAPLVNCVIGININGSIIAASEVTGNVSFVGVSRLALLNANEDIITITSTGGESFIEGPTNSLSIIWMTGQ